MWFIGVGVEQETSAPPPKKNPGSAPVICIMMNYILNDIATYNFYFSDYVKIWTLLLKTIVVKFDYLLKQCKHFHCCIVVHLTTSISFLHIQLPAFTHYLFSLRHYLLPFHPLTTTDTLHKQLFHLIL